MTTTTANIFDRMENDPRWLGFGYLGGRRNALDSSDPECPPQPELVAEMDRLILETTGWDYETAFAWANSKDGRWFADSTFGSDDKHRARDLAMAMRYLREH